MKTWTERIGDRNSGNAPGENAAWWVNDKLKLHRFCDEVGIPMPRLLGVWTLPEELSPADLTEPVVLKPSVMFSTWGVMVLEPRGNGLWHEALRDRFLNFEQIVAEQKSAYERCKFKGSYRLIAEERISDQNPQFPVPLDYKVAVFYDRAELVQQINRNGGKAEYTFMDRDFNLLPDRLIVSDWKTINKGIALPPHQGGEMIRIAEALTKALKTPFMRVDMYNGIGGPVVGELTPSPGDAFYGNNYKYSAEYDRTLGECWSKALDRIKADAVTEM